jgi:hypothetical protein
MFVRATRELADDVSFMSTETRPVASIAREEYQAYERTAKGFGLSPSSRTRISEGRAANQAEGGFVT